MGREIQVRLARRWMLPVVLGLALVLNVCGLPLEDHLHAAAVDGAATTPASDHHDGESVSCDAHASPLPTQPDTLVGPTLGAPIDAIVPTLQARWRAPLSLASTTYRPPLFLRHASLLI